MWCRRVCAIERIAMRTRKPKVFPHLSADMKSKLSTFSSFSLLMCKWKYAIILQWSDRYTFDTLHHLMHLLIPPFTSIYSLLFSQRICSVCVCVCATITLSFLGHRYRRWICCPVSSCVQMDKLLQQIYNFLIVTAVQRIWKSEHIANPWGSRPQYIVWCARVCVRLIREDQPTQCLLVPLSV